MSYDNKGKTLSLISDAEYTSRYIAVKKSAVAEQFTVCAAGDVPIGILQEPVGAAGRAAQILIGGVSFVEASAAIAAGASVTTAGDGLAVTAGAGDTPFGVALNAATAAGDIISVLLKTVGNPSANQVILNYTAADLEAGADLTAQTIGTAGFAGTIVAAKVISLGVAAGVDAANTSVFAIKKGTTTLATKTFNNTVAFPASGAVASLTIAEAAVGADDVLTLSVTNGATADLPAFIVQLFIG